MTTTDTTKVYRGRIVERDYGDALDVVFLECDGEPLAKQIEDHLRAFGRTVSVSYFLANEPHTKEQLEDNLIRVLSGDLEAEYTDHYSEITGYLWTDEGLAVGGHNLLDKIRSGVGRYLHLEIVYHGGPR